MKTDAVVNANKKKKSKRIVILTGIALIIGIIIGTQYYVSKKPKAVEVSLTKVQKANLVQSVTVTGNIETKDKNEIQLTPGLKVIEVYANEGQTVKKGDILAKVDTTDYEYQLKKSLLSLDAASSNLSKLASADTRNDKASLENAVKTAEINLESTKNNYNDAVKKLDQNKSLYDNGYLAKNDYEASQKVVSDLESQIKSADIRLTDARNSLTNFGVNTGDKMDDQRKQIESINTDIENLRNKIENSTITANIDGKVTKMDARKGEIIKAGDSIQIYDTSLYKVSADVSQYDAVNITKGQKVEIKVKGIDKKYEGTVSDIAQTAEKSIGTTGQEYKVNVKISMDDPDEKIKAGYEADTEIILNKKSDVLSVNFEAVKQNSDGGKFVFGVKDNKVVKIPIKTGIQTDIDIEITEGLKENEEYISTPPDTLKEGDLVKLPGGKKK